MFKLNVATSQHFTFFDIDRTFGIMLKEKMLNSS